jgi:hypothetical protein
MYKVYGTEKYQDFLRFLDNNRERFSFYTESINKDNGICNILYCIDEMYAEVFAIGEIEYDKPITGNIKVYLIKPTIEKVYVDIVDNYIFYYPKDSDRRNLYSYEIDKTNYGLRVILLNNKEDNSNFIMDTKEKKQLVELC